MIKLRYLLAAAAAMAIATPTFAQDAPKGGMSSSYKQQNGDDGAHRE